MTSQSRNSFRVTDFMKCMNYEMRKHQIVSVPPQFIEEITNKKKMSKGLLWGEFQETRMKCHVRPAI
jgi:hypothetical protein